MASKLTGRLGLLVLGVILALDIAAAFVSHWLGVALAGIAAVVGVAWLVYLLNVYDLRPWRHR